jgi:hypothetical protein
MSEEVKQYLIQDLNYNEETAYNKYINGDDKYCIWIEKASARRDKLLELELKCQECNNWVSIRETGVCECSKGHFCYDIVLNAIKKLI